MIIEKRPIFLNLSDKEEGLLVEVHDCNRPSCNVGVVSQVARPLKEQIQIVFWYIFMFLLSLNLSQEILFNSSDIQLQFDVQYIYLYAKRLCSPIQTKLAGDQPKDLNAKTFALNARNIKKKFFYESARNTRLITFHVIYNRYTILDWNLKKSMIAFTLHISII